MNTFIKLTKKQFCEIMRQNKVKHHGYVLNTLIHKDCFEFRDDNNIGLYVHVLGSKPKEGFYQTYYLVNNFLRIEATYKPKNTLTIYSYELV